MKKLLKRIGICLVLAASVWCGSLLADRQRGLLTRGCEGFVRPIEARFRQLGGAITYTATVAEILRGGSRQRSVQE